MMPFNADMGESRLGQSQHQAAHSLIGDKDIAAATQHSHGNFLLQTFSEQSGQFLDGSGLGQKLRRPAPLEVSLRRERLLPFNNLAEFFQHAVFSKYY